MTRVLAGILLIFSALRASALIDGEAAIVSERAQREEALICKLQADTSRHRAYVRVDVPELEPYGEDMYVLPGEEYQNIAFITRSAYLRMGDLSPVWNPAFPSESLANLVVFPSDSLPEANVKVTILKHEYGEQATLALPLSRLLQACEDEGCKAYWGLEALEEDGSFSGAIFLYNREEGYDHVIRLKGCLEDVFSGKGEIQARASLYIPTDNVDNIFQPYISRKER